MHNSTFVTLLGGIIRSLKSLESCVHKSSENHLRIKTHACYTLQPPPSKVVHGDIFVAERFVGWQEGVLLALQSAFNKDTKVCRV